MTPTRYRTLRIDDLGVFYREAGPADAPAVTAAARLSFVVEDVAATDRPAR